MTWVSLYSHPVALLQVQSVYVMVISLTGILKLHLHKVSALGIARHIGKPVVGIQLVVAPAYSFSAQSSGAGRSEGKFHILIVCHVLLIED